TDAGVGRRQLLDVPGVAMPPGNRQVVAQLLGPPSTADTDGPRRIVEDLAPLDKRTPLVEEGSEGPHHKRLALTTFTEKPEVMPGEKGRLELGEHCFVKADDSRKRMFSIAEADE